MDIQLARIKGTFHLHSSLINQPELKKWDMTHLEKVKEANFEVKRLIVRSGGFDKDVTVAQTTGNKFVKH